MARRTDEEALAAKSTTIREQSVELSRLRRELERALAERDLARGEVVVHRELVRFVMRDTVVADLAVQVRPGSTYDLTMMELLVQVAREDALTEQIVEEWRERRERALLHPLQVGIVVDGEPVAETEAPGLWEWPRPTAAELGRR